MSSPAQGAKDTSGKIPFEKYTKGAPCGPTGKEETVAAIPDPQYHLLEEHSSRAHGAFGGEFQSEEYVGRLTAAECARGFDEVLRTWALYVLSGLEGG